MDGERRLTLPGAESGPAAAKRASHLGKSALLISLLALLPLLVHFSVFGKIGSHTSDELTILGFSAAATFVLMIWSLVLSVRAFLKGEQDHWPSAAMLVLSGEAAGLVLLFLAALIRW